ncbi:lamin tail domain-containing protein [Candidatus Uhrbacteria bacterium]|nr:lamin tail domain-containing protein [Candidatus Uhrbacteria bacterium]
MHHRGLTILSVCISFVLAVSPMFSRPAYAAASDIVITEIAAYEKSEHEWIEIYNKGSSSIDITGWKFVEDGTNHGLKEYRGDLTIDPGEYAVIADNAAATAADYPAFTGTLIDSAWQTLRADGEAIALASADGSIIEQFTYLPAPDGSLQRISADINDYTGANWIESAAGTNTIGAKNVYEMAADNPPVDGQSDQVASSSAPNATIQSPWKPAWGDVVINEFVADPGDDPREWVELYNNSPVPIDLKEWFLEDGSRNTIKLSEILGVSGSARFAVFEFKNAMLNNAGDSITVRDKKGTAIDSVSYGGWDDGVIENNAPRAYAPASVARFPDGRNTFNNADDFHVTVHATPGESNILKEEKSAATPPYQSAIVISELFPYPFPSATSTEEFIELYNSGEEPIDIDGWRLVSGSVSYVISDTHASSTLLAPEAYFIVPRSASAIALKNYGGDSVKLYQKGGEKSVTHASYAIDAPRNKSYARGADDRYAWTETVTPGKPNIMTKQNEPPRIALFAPLSGTVSQELFFDASDTQDPDNDQLAYEWDFGDGSPAVVASLSAVHTYRAVGIYEIALTVRAGVHEKIETRHITIIDSPTPRESIASSVELRKKSEISSSSPSVPTETATSSPTIFFNELLPNPTGPDRGQEFIELYNAGDAAVDISQWIIELQGGRTHYTIPQGSHVPPYGFFVTPTNGRGFVLRNSGDELVLRDWYGTAIDSIDYTESPEGKSFARGEANDWIWTSDISRGVKNIIAGVKISKQVPPNDTVILSESEHTLQQPSAKDKNTASNLPIHDFEQLRGVKQNTPILVRGTVTVPAGLFDPTELYISDGKNGMLVRYAKSDLPKFAIGDFLEARGSFKKYVSGPAVSIGSEGSVRALSNGDGKTVERAQLTIQSINDETLNALATISGEVTQVRWPHIYLKDATGEIRAYVKKSTGIEKMDVQKGQLVDVIGIVGKTASGYRILPRTADDIVITSSRRVEVTENPEYTIVARHATLPSYGVAALVAITVVFGGLFLQYYQRKRNE